jgi:ATP-dependent DNA helicase RecQ
VNPKTDPAGQTLQFIQRFKDQPGIIYCFSRQQVDDLAAYLSRKGYAVRPYHAGLEDETRRQNQDAFVRDDVQIIVATIAFGMGINKPNVRFIIHFDLPKSIESYYQEIGRAGRDGLPAHCLMLYSYADVHKLRYFIDQKEESERQNAYQHLQALTRYAESDVCRRVPLLAYFGETYATENCGMCDNCQNGQQEQVDITIPAQKFLSCVKRTGQVFGAQHIVDVLLGADNAKVRKFNHQQLSTYGIGSELSREQWLHIGRQMVQKGLLEADERFGGLKLTAKASEVLRAREPIYGILQEEQALKPAAKKVGEIENDRELFERLRQKRKALADEGRVPPYVIFSDRTLVEMAAYYPQSEASLLQINGVGQTKLARYGQLFLEVIQSYCAERGLGEKPKGLLRLEARRTEPVESIKKPRHQVVGEAYNAGRSLQSLVEEYQVQPGTILDHLTKFAQEGNPLRPSDEILALSQLSVERQLAALQAFERLGTERLRPVFDDLHENVSYDELKILRVHYLSRQAPV